MVSQEMEMKTPSGIRIYCFEAYIEFLTLPSAMFIFPNVKNMTSFLEPLGKILLS